MPVPPAATWVTAAAMLAFCAGSVGVLSVELWPSARSPPDGILSLPTRPPQPLVPAATAPQPGVPAPAAAPDPLPLATEADILASASDRRKVFRFALQPEIIVIQFPTLTEQANTLNRVAAFLEKSGLPRDRVLDDVELDRSIQMTGKTAETFYFGHDYRSADLSRFFEAAARSDITLTAQEKWLRQASADWGWQPGTRAAIITLVRTTPSSGIDLVARAAILRHELSHGLYFLSQTYADYADRFWSTSLTRPERAQLRRFLAAQGYDVSLPDLVVNEAQAYLVHTPDPRLFSAARIGVTVGRLAALRSQFAAGMPVGWLRDAAMR